MNIFNGKKQNKAKDEQNIYCQRLKITQTKTLNFDFICDNFIWKMIFIARIYFASHLL